MITTVSPKVACVSIIAGAYVAFLAGRGASVYYHHGTTQSRDSINASINANANASISISISGTNTSTTPTNNTLKSMPSPLLADGKEVPFTKYTSMLFKEGNSALDSLYLDEDHATNEVCTYTDDGHKQCSLNNSSSSSTHEHEHEHEHVTGTPPLAADATDATEDAEHFPAGQHLLVDIKNVDGTFLNSEKRLAEAMLTVVNESKLTLLSYHCHKLIPMGVSCVGVLLESHISFHTWPKEGVITLDLFTCGSGLLVPVMPILEKLFAIPQVPLHENEIVDHPRVVWIHKLRGFRNDAPSLSYLANDLGDIILESAGFDLKVEVAAVITPFQRIDIYDSLDALANDMMSYERSLTNDGSYWALHPELFRPQRSVFLDGVLQSTREGNEAYHEALVQPGMFAHPNPKRVAIIGGGEGATLRQVLKHNTVEKVKMIEIDEMMVKVSREFLPDWNDCSDILGSADWCGDDERAEIYYEDALAWFNNRFSDAKIDTEEFQEEQFDVLIMDALDPQDDIPFAEVLYTDPRFIGALYNALTENGVIIMQLGVAPFSNDPADEDSMNRRRVALLELMEKVGFESMHIYEDGNCGFEDPWTYLVAMKDYDNRGMWYRTQAQIEIDIHERLLRTHSGAPPLSYFDSAQMKAYRYPHKGFETVYCRKDPMPHNCVPELRRPEVPKSDLEVRMSGVGDRSGRGVYTTVDIKEGSYIARSNAHRPIVLHPSSTNLVYKYMEDSKEIDIVEKYFEGYGWQSDMYGENTYMVDSSFMTFVNHGCHGTFNIDDIAGEGRDPYSVTEQNATPSDYFADDDDREVYDPYADRHSMRINAQCDISLRDIKAGEELLNNYNAFTSNQDEWYDEVLSLRKICSGEAIGSISQAEEESAVRAPSPSMSSISKDNASAIDTECTSCGDEL